MHVCGRNNCSYSENVKTSVSNCQMNRNVFSAQSKTFNPQWLLTDSLISQQHTHNRRRPSGPKLSLEEAQRRLVAVAALTPSSSEVYYIPCDSTFGRWDHVKSLVNWTEVNVCSALIRGLIVSIDQLLPAFQGPGSADVSG